MLWLSEDRSIGLYGSTHLEAEVPEIKRFLSELDPMLVMIESDNNVTLMPDMQAAVDFAGSKQRQVAYIGYNIGDAVRGLGRKYPLHTAIHFGIITASQELRNVPTEEELERRVEFVLYNVVEGINPPQKIIVLQEATRYMDQYVAEIWKEREKFSTREGVQEVKSGIEERQEQEPIAGFRQYHQEFEQYTCERIWGNIRNAMGYALNPKGAIVGQWHFPYIRQRLHEFTRT